MESRYSDTSVCFKPLLLSRFYFATQTSRKPAAVSNSPSPNPLRWSREGGHLTNSPNETEISRLGCHVTLVRIAHTHILLSLLVMARLKHAGIAQFTEKFALKFRACMSRTRVEFITLHVAIYLSLNMRFLFVARISYRCVNRHKDLLPAKKNNKFVYIRAV